MTEFKLISSLILSESPEDASRDSGEYMIINETDLNSKSYDQTRGFDYSVYVEYGHPSLKEPLYIVVKAMLYAEYTFEDASFDFAHGSVTGTHNDEVEAFESMQWENISIPQTVDNKDLFAMPQAQFEHITKFIKERLSTMDESEIEKHVDVEHLIELARPVNDY